MFRECEQIYAEVLAEVTRHQTLQCAHRQLVRRMKERARRERARKERRTGTMRARVREITRQSKQIERVLGAKSGVCAWRWRPDVGSQYSVNKSTYLPRCIAQITRRHETLVRR